MRESLRNWLKDEGYEVETVEESEKALQRIREGNSASQFSI